MFPSFWATHTEAPVILQSRTYHSASESRVSNRLATSLFQLLSFCKLERTIALQKIVFPSFWALHAEASVVLQSRTYHCVSKSCVSIFLAVARFAASHGSWVVSRRSHQRKQCLDSAYILSSAAGENITREAKLKSVSKHFVLHCSPKIYLGTCRIEQFGPQAKGILMPLQSRPHDFLVDPKRKKNVILDVSAEASMHYTNVKLYSGIMATGLSAFLSAATLSRRFSDG